MNRREELNGSELITIKEIQLITGLSYEAAKREHAHIRKVLGFGSNDLMVRQYCEFNNLSFEEIVGFLNPYRFKPHWYFKNKFSGNKRQLIRA